MFSALDFLTKASSAVFTNTVFSSVSVVLGIHDSTAFERQLQGYLTNHLGSVA